MSEHLDRPLTERGAAEHLAVSVSTLRRWRWAKKGPTHFRVDNVIRYRPSDLDDFIAQHSEAA